MASEAATGLVSPAVNADAVADLVLILQHVRG